jgi:hypothetical protein
MVTMVRVDGSLRASRSFWAASLKLVGRDVAAGGNVDSGFL